MKRIISTILCLMMILSMIPISVAAAGVSQPYYQNTYDTEPSQKLIIDNTNGTTTARPLLFDAKDSALYNATEQKITSDYVVEFVVKVEVDPTEKGVVALRFERGDTSYGYLALRTSVSSKNNGAFQYFWKSGDETTYLDHGGTTFEGTTRTPISAKSESDPSKRWQAALGFANYSSLGHDVKVRMEVDKSNKNIRVFLNDKYITGVNPSSRKDYISQMSGTKFELEVSKGMKVTVDDLVIAPLYPTVTFDANGGTVDVETMITDRSSKLASLPTASRENYTFDGWFDAADKQVTTDTVYYADTKLTAKWTAKTPVSTTYTITFDAAGGTVTPNEMTTGADGKLASLPTPTRDGYTFDGWFDGDKQVTTDTVYSAAATLTAKWTKNPVSDPSVFYAQNFDSLPAGKTTAEALGWDEPKDAAFTYEVKNGKLIVNSEKNTGLKNIVFLPESDVSKKMAESDYAVEFDFTVRNASTTFFSLLAALNQKTEKFSLLYLRVTPSSGNNSAAFQNMTTGKYLDLDANGSEYNGITRKTLKTGYTGSNVWNILGYSDKSLVNKNVKVRLEVDTTNKVARVFLNGVFATATSTSTKDTYWNRFTSSGGTALGFRIGKGLTVEIDNIQVTAENYPLNVPSYFTITLDAAGGTIVPATVMTDASGKLAFIPQPMKTGYIFEGWVMADGTPVDTDTVFSANTTLTAQWREDPSLNNSATAPNLWLAVLQLRYNREYEITAESNMGGMITPAGVTKVKYNRNQTFNFQANDGYYIADVIVDGVSVGRVTSYTFNKVNKAHSLVVRFEKRNIDPADAQNNVLYAQNFDSLTSVDQLGWEPIDTLFTPTAELSLENGQLIFDNRGSGAKTSYYVFAPSSITDEMVKGNYAVQFDMTFLDANSRDNWFSILFNYDRKTSKKYTVLYFRMRGDWSAFQNRNASWANLDAGGTEYLDANGNLVTRSSIITTTAGKTLPDVIFNTASSGMTLKDKKMTVRVEVDTESQLTRVFVNDIYLTGSNGKTSGGWKNFINTASGGTELAFRCSSGIRVALDNVILVKGLDIPKN